MNRDAHVKIVVRPPGDELAGNLGQIGILLGGEDLEVLDPHLRAQFLQIGQHLGEAGEFDVHARRGELRIVHIEERRREVLADHRQVGVERRAEPLRIEREGRARGGQALAAGEDRGVLGGVVVADDRVELLDEGRQSFLIGNEFVHGLQRRHGFKLRGHEGEELLRVRNAGDQRIKVFGRERVDRFGIAQQERQAIVGDLRLHGEERLAAGGEEEIEHAGLRVRARAECGRDVQRIFRAVEREHDFVDGRRPPGGRGRILGHIAAREEQRQAHQQRENAACSHWNEPPCRFPNFSDEFASSTSLYHEGRARTIRTRPKPRNLR